MTGTRRWLGCLIGLALHHLAIGQLPTTYANSPFDAANYLTGPNVTFSNVSFTGYSDQLRSFGGALSAIGIGEGIVLTTGLASYAGIDYAEEQLNSHQQYDNQSGGQHRPVPPNSAVYGDSDLDMINGISSVHNVAILEFDFVSTNTEVVFDFAFASEEYPEETCCPWNDVIGIFLSGPDILGTFSNNAVNLALIPGTTVPVNVNTINSGSASGLSQCEETDCSDLDPNWQTNSNYYNHNQPNTSALAGQFVYDGFTDVLHAQHAILCNQTYHIKIAICNTRDYNKDSGLFIRAGTIDSPYPQFLSNLLVTPQPVCEGETLNLSIDGDL